MNEVMTPELAEKFVSRRAKRPRETWKRSTIWIAPHLNPDSVKAYVSKYQKIKLEKEKFPIRKLSEAEKDKLNETYTNIIYNKFLSYDEGFKPVQTFRVVG